MQRAVTKSRYWFAYSQSYVVALAIKEVVGWNMY